MFLKGKCEKEFFRNRPMILTRTTISIYEVFFFENFKSIFEMYLYYYCEYSIEMFIQLTNDLIIDINVFMLYNASILQSKK